MLFHHSGQWEGTYNEQLYESSWKADNWCSHTRLVVKLPLCSLRVKYMLFLNEFITYVLWQGIQIPLVHFQCASWLQLWSPINLISSNKEYSITYNVVLHACYECSCKNFTLIEISIMQFTVELVSIASRFWLILPFLLLQNILTLHLYHKKNLLL